MAGCFNGLNGPAWVGLIPVFSAPVERELRLPDVELIRENIYHNRYGDDRWQRALKRGAKHDLHHGFTLGDDTTDDMDREVMLWRAEMNPRQLVIAVSIGAACAMHGRDEAPVLVWKAPRRHRCGALMIGPLLEGEAASLYIRAWQHDGRSSRRQSARPNRCISCYQRRAAGNNRSIRRLRTVFR